MSYAIGFAIAAGVALLGRYAGFDRDRAFYPTVLIVTASYYVLFAVIGGSAHAVVLESAVMVMFALAAYPSGGRPSVSPSMSGLQPALPGCSDARQRA